MWSAILFILICPIGECLEIPLQTYKNEGIQQFQHMGFLLDDVVPTRLMVEISLQPGLKAVYKVETLLRHKDANATTLIKVLRTGLSQDMLTAAERLRDTERLMFKVPDLPDRQKRQFFGAAAMATAAYAVYDVHQLRGTMTEVSDNQEIITQQLDTVVDDVNHLAEAQTTTNNILKALDAEVMDMQFFMQLMNLQRTASDYCYHTAAALDMILQRRLTTGLVSEAQLHRGFKKLRQKAWRRGLQPVIQDPKQAYQLEASFEAKIGQPLRVWVDIPMTPVGGGHQYKLLQLRILPYKLEHSTWLLRKTTELIGISPTDGKIVSLDATDLDSCTKLGETYLCNNIGTEGLVAGHSCTAAVYLEDMATIRSNCHATQLTDKTYINRLNATSFVSYMPAPTTAAVTCRIGSSNTVLYDLQVSHIRPGCTVNVHGTTIHSPVHSAWTVIRTERRMPQVAIPSRRDRLDMPTAVNIQEQHINITKAIVGKEPIMEAVDDVTEWINSVWKKFLGYGTAICTLVMLIFCMAWCFRRSVSTQGQGPRTEQPVVSYHSSPTDQETTVATIHQNVDRDIDNTAAGDTKQRQQATPPPCHRPPASPANKGTPTDEDTVEVT